MSLLYLKYNMQKEKNIEALIFTDLHLNAINKDICLNFFDKLISFAKEKNIENIFFLGDFTDNRKGLDLITISTILSIFKKIKESNLEFYLIPGNHDKFIVSNEESYLEICKYNHLFENIYLKSIGSFDYIFFPYFEGQYFEKGIEYLKNIKLERDTILLGHYMYEQIPSEIKNKFAKVFLGHNHEKGEFPNGMYIGSCFQQNFSEDNNKGFSILYNDLSVELIPFCEKEYILQKIDVNVFDLKKIKDFILNFKEKNKNKLLKIELVGVNKDISEIKEFLKQNDIVFVSKIENNTENIREEILNISEFSHNQIIKYFNDFCQENTVDKKVKEKIIIILNS